MNFKMYLFGAYASAGLVVFANAAHEQKELTLASGRRIFQEHSTPQTRSYDSATFVSRMRQLEPLCREHGLFTQLSSLLPGVFNANGLVPEPVLTPEVRFNLEQLHRAADSDILEFVRLLQMHGVMHPEISEREAALVRRGGSMRVMQKYATLARVVYASPDAHQEDTSLHMLANRAFEFCFSPSSVERYLQLLCTPQSHAVVRCLHSLVWDAFVVRSWHDWHQECLQQLAEKNRDGKRITYLFGGIDIHSLLTQGIYNFDIIDPMFPSQHQFYPDGWHFLLGDQDQDLGLGDEIRCPVGDQHVLLRRVSVRKFDDQVCLTPSSGAVTIPAVTCTWEVYDAQGVLCGTCSIQRRLVTHDDLCNRAAVIVIPFNELNIMLMPQFLGGGMLDLKDLPFDATWYVPQLRQPINKPIMCNMRLAHMLNETDLQFFQLVAPLY